MRAAGSLLLGLLVTRTGLCLVSSVSSCRASDASVTPPPRMSPPSIARSASPVQGVTRSGLKRRALLAAVGAYPAASGWPELKGPVPDAQAIGDLLIGAFQFERENVCILTEQDVTHDGLLRAIDEFLVEPADENTVCLFFFAGHGSQVSDQDGDEADGFDETLVPVDGLGESEARNDVLDDELATRFEALERKCRSFVGIFDCCHSGTLQRSADGAYRARWVERGSTQESGSASSEDSLAGSDSSRSPRDSSKYPQLIDLTERSGRGVYLFACQDYQPAHELDDLDRGVLSLCLQQALSSLGRGETWSDLFHRVQCEMRRLVSTQEPMLIGGWDEVVFAGEFAPLLKRFPVVRGEQPGEIAVLAGSAHGVSAGSRFLIETDVLHPEWKELHSVVTLVTGAGRCLARIEGAGEHDLESIEDRRARLLSGDLPDFSLRLAIPEAIEGLPASDLAEFRDRLQSSSYVQPAGSGTKSAYRLDWTEQQGFRVLDPIDQVLVPHSSAGHIDRPDIVVAHLDRYVHWRALRALDNPEDELARSVTVRIVPGVIPNSSNPEDRKLQPLEKLSLARSGAVIVSEQDGRRAAVRINVKNDGDRTVYLWILDLMPNWGVEVVCPNQSVSKDIEHLGRGYRILKQESFERDFLLSRKGHDGIHPPAEMIKIFVCAERTDLDNLRSGGAASRGMSATSALERLLHNSQSGTRGTDRSTLSGWTSSQFEFCWE